FFPWAAYLAFGVSAGSALRLIAAERLDRAMQWMILAAGLAIACCQYCAHLPYSVYAASDFWLHSPSHVITNQSLTLILLSLPFVCTQYIEREGWSWLRQFGTTTLLVYWVHIELIYGRWIWFFKERLTVVQTSALAVLVILFLLGVSSAKTYRKEVL